MELLREKLKREAALESLPQDLASAVFLVAHEMHWTIEYVMEMPPWMLETIAKQIQEYYEAQRKASVTSGMVSTLG